MQLDEPRPAKHAMQASGPARQLAAHATTAAPQAIFLYQGQSPEIAFGAEARGAGQADHWGSLFWDSH